MLQVETWNLETGESHFEDIQNVSTNYFKTVILQLDKHGWYREMEKLSGDVQLLKEVIRHRVRIRCWVSWRGRFRVTNWGPWQQQAVWGRCWPRWHAFQSRAFALFRCALNPSSRNHLFSKTRPCVRAHDWSIVGWLELRGWYLGRKRRERGQWKERRKIRRLLTKSRDDLEGREAWDLRWIGMVVCILCLSWVSFSMTGWTTWWTWWCSLTCTFSPWSIIFFSTGACTTSSLKRLPSNS